MRRLYLLFISFFIFICTIFAQQRSVCEITPLHVGKYPILLAKYSNQELSDMFALDSLSYIDITSSSMTIVVDGKTRHNFQYSSIPRSGINYLLYDDLYDADIPVYIFYVKDEKTKDKSFGIFVQYKEDLEWVFSYKAGTQFKDE